MAELTTIRVLIVDDEALVRAGLRLVLDGSHGIRIAAEAADGAAAIAVLEREEIDLVLMDVRMPGMDGIAATERIRASRPDLPIVILTTFDTDESVLTALQAGASGFLLKDTQPAELVEAVRRSAEGRIMLSPAVTRRLVAAATRLPEPTVRERARERLTVLTPREVDVAYAIADGLSNAEIAARLFLSVTTVKSHTAHILTKLGVANRVQIAIAVHESRE